MQSKNDTQTSRVLPSFPSGNTVFQYLSQDVNMDTVLIQNISIITESLMFPFYSHAHFLCALMSSFNPWQPLICFPTL